MIKKKKILSLLLLCLFISIFNVSEVNAFSDDTSSANYGFTTPSSSDGGPGNSNPGNNNNGNDGNNNSGKWAGLQDGSKKIIYRYSVSLNGGINYSIKSTSLNDGIIKSGTWVGINIHENQSASWSVSNIESKEVKKVYTCTIKKTKCNCYEGWKYISGVGYRIRTICPGDSAYNWSHCDQVPEVVVNNEEHNYFDPSPCPSGSEEQVTEKEIGIATPGIVREKIIGKVYGAAKSMVGAPLSKVQITTDDLDEKNEYKTLTISAKLDPSESIDTGPALSGRIVKAYIYKPDNICINLKTGKVSYNKECTKEEEVQISPYVESGISFWQYFSPLDMKSGSNFSLIIKNNVARKLSAEACHSFMDKYKNDYQTRIISINNKTLKGDYCKNGSCSNLNKGSGSDWQEVSKGCYFTRIKTFDVVQKYYYEETKNNQLMFNGYNIYYRSINIDNPFPNTPTKNSLWYDWYNSTNKNPNLKDSFKEMTYSVAVSNKLADTIRAYNVNNPYPSFDKLSLAGESEFLRSIGVNSLTKDKYYKLGGGTKTCIKDKKVSIGSDCS